MFWRARGSSEPHEFNSENHWFQALVNSPTATRTSAGGVSNLQYPTTDSTFPVTITLAGLIISVLS